MFRALRPYVVQYRARVALAGALLVLAKLSIVAVPVLLKLIVDRLGDPARLVATPAALLLGYAALRFGGTLFGELRDLVFSRVSHRVMADFHARAFAHVLRLDARFHLRRETGRLARELEQGIAGIGFLLGVGLFTIVPTLVEIFAVMLILVFNYTAWFIGIILLTFLAYTSFTVAFTQRRTVHQRATNDLDSRAGGRLVDSLLNYEAVKAHGAESLEARRYSQLLGNWAEAGLANQRALSALHIGQSGIIAVGVAAVMLLAGKRVLTGTMSVGDLVLVNAYVIQICLPLNALGFVFRQARDAMVNAEKLAGLLAERPEIEDRPGAPALVVRRGEIEFDRVSFAYERERPVLTDVSFRIAPGRTVAIVGGSGSGKSTLARLLLRLYDPVGGAVRIDRQDLREVTQTSLRAAVGLVPQDTLLFNDTIGWNIVYGRPETNAVEMVQAARVAHIDELIDRLPEKFATTVGERGLRLSGGEKQRLAIARVVLRDPRILVFDEATSALDVRTERAIQAELDRLARGRTSLVIAHRLSTIIDADEILVLERGRIVERGSHARLVALGGAYARLWSLQQKSGSEPDFREPVEKPVLRRASR